MGGIFNNPPTGDGNLPDIQPPDFVTTGKQTGAGISQSGTWDDLVNKFRHSSWDAISWAVSFFVSGVDDVITLIVKLITAFQGLNSPGFFQLIAAVMSDLMGVEVPADAMRASFQQRGQVAAMKTVGAAFYNLLEGEFAAGQTPGTPNATADPAKAFLGFLISFAIREGNLDFFCEILPESFDIIKGLRNYGETMAENLGLGRLARRAFQPLVQLLVSDPLTYMLNAQYRPKLVTYTEAVEGYVRGFIDRATLNQWMAWQGFSDQAIQLYIDYYTPKWTPIELVDLERAGQMDDATAISLLQQAGYSQGQANRVLTAYQAQAANGIVHQQANQIARQVELGLIDQATGRSLIAELPLLDGEKQEYSHLLGVRGEFGWKQLTESEMERAFLGGIIDISAIQSYWQSVGYNAAGIQILTLLLLQKQSTGNRTTAGHVPHKSLTEAELEKAYKAGIITLPQLQGYWTALGYNAASIQILTQLVG